MRIISEGKVHASTPMCDLEHDCICFLFLRQSKKLSHAVKKGTRGLWALIVPTVPPIPLYVPDCVLLRTLFTTRYQHFRHYMIQMLRCHTVTPPHITRPVIVDCFSSFPRSRGSSRVPTLKMWMTESTGRMPEESFQLCKKPWHRRLRNCVRLQWDCFIADNFIVTI